MANILLVDDEPNNLHVLRQILKDEHHLYFAKDGPQALERARSQQPELILLDIMMPGMDGYEVCRQLKLDEQTRAIPVIFVTAMSDVEDEARGFDAGAVDYITKPVSRPIVQARVKTHLSLVRVEELHQVQLELIHRLGRAAEYKDMDTGRHVIRMGYYARIIARALGMSEEESELLFNAAPMHDIGKIGVPDAILSKPAPLDDEQWQIMRQHPDFGARIMGDHPAALLQMARVVAQHHHEKWDGSGYPAGLAGEAIPLPGRIVAVADVFDALTSRRPYKEAWSLEATLALLREQSGKHFDPQIVTAFESCLDEILEVKKNWADE